MFLGIHGKSCIVGKRKGRPPGSKNRPKSALTSVAATTSFCVAATKSSDPPAPQITSTPPAPQTTSRPPAPETSSTPKSAEPETQELEVCDDQVIQHFSQSYFDLC